MSVDLCEGLSFDLRWSRYLKARQDAVRINARVRRLSQPQE